MLLFLLSLILLVTSCGLAAHVLGRSARERFWVFMLGWASQLGLLTVGLSYKSHLIQKYWLMGQAVLVGFWLIVWVIYLGPRSAMAHLRGIPTYLRLLRDDARSFSIGEATWVLVIFVFCGIGAWRQFYNPIAGYDEIGYHLPRILYWLQEKTVFVHPTNNMRQTVFTFGSELNFLWARLFVSGETFPRLVFWLHQPLATIGVFVLARELGVTRGKALACAALYAASPTVGTYSLSLKPDGWLAFYSTAIGFWAVRLCNRARGVEDASDFFSRRERMRVRTNETALADSGNNVDLPAGPSPLPAPEVTREIATTGEIARLLFFCGFAWATAISIKPTIVPLAASLVLIFFLVPIRGARFVGALTALFGVVLGLALCTAGTTFAFNIHRYKHPLGTADFRKAHQPDANTPYLRTHLARIPVALWEYPEMPLLAVRHQTEEKMHAYMNLSGASRKLPQEENANWPGPFTFSVPLYAGRYSLPGLFWLPALAIGFIVLVRECWKNRRAMSIGPIATLTLLAIPALLVPALLIRWMGGGPDRFWIGGFSLALPLIFALGQIALRGPWLAGVGTLLCIYTVYPSFHRQMEYIDYDLSHPLKPGEGSSYYEVSKLLDGKDAIIVNFGSFNAPDYLLFGSNVKKPRIVIPWGPNPFEVNRLKQLIDNRKVTHVVIEQDQGQGIGWWNFFMPTQPVWQWLGANGYREIKLATPGVRLFETPNAKQ